MGSYEVHGGLKEPVNRIIPEGQVAEKKQHAQTLAQYNISNGDLSTLNRMGDGGLSPLTGPMTQDVYNQVLEEEIIMSNGKKYAWTIPLAFPIAKAEADQLKKGQDVAVIAESGDTVGILSIADIFPWDKHKYNSSVYGTSREDHPGARIANDDPRDYLLGGEVQVFPQAPNPHFGQFVLTPTQTRALFKQKGWEKVVAFQTRNPLHRAHEYAMVAGMEEVTRQGHFTGVVLNPLVGETKSDDVDAATRMHTYQCLIDNHLLGDGGDKDTELWQEKGYDINDQFILLGLDIKMFYGGPKEAVMHGIYRQNFGFTNIVIGRKHADAPYDDGSDIWDPLEAQRIFEKLKGELQIKNVNIGFAAFYEELGHVGLVDAHKDKGWHAVSISGRQLREMFIAGEVPDPRVIRPEVSKILIESYRNKKS
ncbi:sulfate adenylyltransferase [Thermodesulfobacteriota bacterium]